MRGAGRSRVDRRTPFLAVAIATSAVAGGTLLVRGRAWVNLDSALEEPLAFSALFLIPASLAVGSLLAAALPRIVLINLAVFAGLLGALETAAWVLTPAAPVIEGEPEAIGAPTFYPPDATLGYVLAPSTVARHRRTVDGAPIYDVTYETDDRGRRRTPTPPGPDRRSFLLFFGDSNTFGEGLEQTQTLPYHAGLLAPAVRPYNYGVPGYGPAHLLALARTERLGAEVAEGEGHAVFFLIPAHVARVIGSSKVSTGWGRHFPHYAIGPRGDLVARGDFVHGRPLTTLAYFFWSRSSLARYFDVDLPPSLTAADYRLTAKILAEASRRLARQVRLRGFHVILGQVYNEPQRRVIQSLREALAREGVPHLDYARLFDTSDPRYRVSDFDYHNSAEANRLIAARLVADLGIGR